MAKYVISKLDNNEYCQTNGQFTRHIISNGHTLQSYYEAFIGNVELCQYCNNVKSFISMSKGYYDTCGDHICRGKSISNSKQNITDAQRKIQSENIKSSINSKSSEELDAINIKRKATNILKYGTDHPWKSKEIRDKIKATLHDKYGSDNYSSALLSEDATSSLNDFEYMYDLHITKKMPMTEISKVIGVTDVTVGNYLRSHNIDINRYNSSYGENEVVSFIESLDVTNIVTNSRDIIPSGREIDIYLPDYNLAIEYCGLFWHSDYHDKITKNYHSDKHSECAALGIRLITMYEDEWVYSGDLVRQKLKHFLSMNLDKKIYARKTKFSPISTTDAKNFLNTYHIQGYGGGSFKYGLLDDEECLVAVMVFKKHKDGYSLDRYATACNVVGGFSKMLKNSINMDINGCTLVTFADLRWSVGDLYFSSGFSLDKVIPPDYEYIHNGKRYHKFNYRRRHLPKKLKTFDINKSEASNCRDNNIFKIYDCGKMRFIRNV